jgi:hypothetical protein
MYPTEQMHAVTATLPVTDTLEPDGHAEQSAAPTVAAYVPAGHEEHVAEPIPLLYVPASHAAQLSPLATSPVNPAGHPQLMLPSVDTALIGQLVHSAEPVPLLYVPAVHAAQLPPLAAASPVKPAAHAQLLIDVLPSADTTLMVTPTEQPQNITAGRWSPISDRHEKGLAGSKDPVQTSSQSPYRPKRSPHVRPRPHLRTLSVGVSARKRGAGTREAVVELGGQGPSASSPRSEVSPKPSTPDPEEL